MLAYITTHRSAWKWRSYQCANFTSQESASAWEKVQSKENARARERGSTFRSRISEVNKYKPTQRKRFSSKLCFNGFRSGSCSFERSCISKNLACQSLDDRFLKGSCKVNWKVCDFTSKRSTEAIETKTSDNRVHRSIVRINNNNWSSRTLIKKKWCDPAQKPECVWGVCSGREPVSAGSREIEDPSRIWSEAPQVAEEFSRLLDFLVRRCSKTCWIVQKGSF